MIQEVSLLTIFKYVLINFANYGVKNTFSNVDLIANEMKYLLLNRKSLGHSFQDTAYGLCFRLCASCFVK